MLTKDISNTGLLYAKGFLFLVAGVLAATILLLENPSLHVAMLLGLCVWCFARAYFFVFYVVEHYVDGKYRYRGIVSFLKYVLRGQVPSEEMKRPD